MESGGGGGGSGRGERVRDRREKCKGGIWRGADYAEQTQQLAGKAKKKTFTSHRGGRERRREQEMR